MRKLTLLLLLCGLFLTSTVYAGEPSIPDRRPTYSHCRNEKRAIVVGASVSLGFFGPSPSMLYLERAGFSHDCILKKSFPITDGYDKLPWLKKAIASFKPDVIIGVDLLFHDVHLLRHEDLLNERIQHVMTLLDYLASLQIPVVVGTVFSLDPDLYPFQAKIVQATNLRLCELQGQTRSHLFVMPTARIFKELYNNDFLINGPHGVESLDKRDVLVDQFHVGPYGAYLLANRLIGITNHASVERGYPFTAREFSPEFVDQQEMTWPIMMKVDPFAHPVNVLGGLIKMDGKDTLALVSPTTIPADIGDGMCPGFDGFTPSP